MNVANESESVGVLRCCLAVGLAASIFNLAGCGGAPRLPTAKQLAAFEQVGPVQPQVDHAELVRVKIPVGPYRVVAGDVLELQLPAVLQAVGAEIPGRTEAHLTRVTRTGTINLPIVGEIQAAGKTLAQIESAVIDAYYPQYVKKLPSVVARVSEYQTTSVTIGGAVQNPGLYQLRRDELTLVVLIMKAGGIVEDGAALIRIRRPGAFQQTAPLALPVKDGNIPFADVALTGGETVTVEHLEPQVFLVTGLVKKPGSFPYPSTTTYSLTQALSFAGGVDDLTDPRYAKVYRQDADGRILSAAFKIADDTQGKTSRFFIKPGDIVAVEHTSRTRWRQAWANMFRVTTGMVVGATYDVNSD